MCADGRVRVSGEENGESALAIGIQWREGGRENRILIERDILHRSLNMDIEWTHNALGRGGTDKGTD